MNRRRGSNRPPPPPPQAQAGGVPAAAAVTPGARVAIVLKADQASGRETAGTVAAVLTRGEHPRGVKVRLGDGRVGRVRRLLPTTTTTTTTTAARSVAVDCRLEPEEPPPRTLADFFVPAAVARCPVCEAFEGDEAAVTLHVEREHFS
ncbi:hypothetical protein CDD83_2109 [Cordyceps sp. RAO-2017]|nr:hypothetical protein CDD83_2109 [Cordyceps sp. RAO-2017]